ncbi:13594_t:CDS:2 [Entrophospora sp. SA101]|nr:13594_t:CDS:2 [Entrophospora sp. SA101]
MFSRACAITAPLEAVSGNRPKYYYSFFFEYFQPNKYIYIFIIPLHANCGVAEPIKPTKLAVLIILPPFPCFPYSRQPDASHKRSGAPLSHKQTNNPTGYTYDTPAILDPIFTSPLSSQVDDPFSAAFKKFGEQNSSSNGLDGLSTRSIANNNDGNSGSNNNGYRHWIAQSGTLVANLLTCAGYYIAHPDDVGISNKIYNDFIHDFMSDMFEQISKEAARLADY